MQRREFVLWGCLGALAGGIGRSLAPSWTGEKEATGQLIAGDPEESELVMLFMASRSCPFSVDPGLRRVLREVAGGLLTSAEAAGLGFATCGFSHDLDALQGIAFLRSFLDFDEVSSGRRWRNRTVEDIVWDGLPSSRSTPQVVLLMTSPRAVPGVPRPELGYESMTIARFMGIAEISRLADAGFRQRLLSGFGT